MKSVNNPSPSPKGTGAWESEGGSLAPQESVELPQGISASTVTHYRVGPYSYTNLDDAMAQYNRQKNK